MRSLIAAIGCSAALAACGQSIDTAEWTEEVRLSDGRMVVVWRKDRRASYGFPNAKRGRLIDFELKYEPMGVTWKDAASSARSPNPVSFDIVDGVPVLVLSTGDREWCRSRASTDYAAQFLKWIDGRWAEVPQSDFPVDRVLINLYGRRWGHTTADDARGLVTWQLKAERDGFYPDRPDTVRSYFSKGARTCGSVLKI